MSTEQARNLRFIETMSVEEFKKLNNISRMEVGVATKKDGTITEKFCACYNPEGIVKTTMAATASDITKPVISRVIDDTKEGAVEFNLLHNQGEINFAAGSLIL